MIDLPINHPVIYPNESIFYDQARQKPRSEGGVLAKCQRAALAILPLVAAIHRRARGPISLGFSCLRTFLHGRQMCESLYQHRFLEGGYQLFHATLGVAAVALFFFNPVFTFLLSSASNLVINTRTLIESLLAQDYRAALEAAAFIGLDALFIAALCSGQLEVVVVCMAFQILLDCYLSWKHFQNGDLLEGTSQLLLGGIHARQMVPQARLLQWKLQHQPTLHAELKQDPQGFVYLDIPDEHLDTLRSSLTKGGKIEPPPYFGPGRAGAHVSVIAIEELTPQERTLLANSIGKQFDFQISHVDALDPGTWNGVQKVHFVTIRSPQLEQLRQEVGLPPKMDHHDFHITFGIERTPISA